MAYDEGLAHRLREIVEDDPTINEKKMFGGLCFLVSGNMCFGIVGDELMVRVGPDAYGALLEEPHAREMDFTGRAMKGMIYVSAEGFAEDEDLAAWTRRGLGFAGSLPAKQPKAAKKVPAKAAKTVAKRAAKKGRKKGTKNAAKKKAVRKAARKSSKK